MYISHLPRNLFFLLYLPNPAKANKPTYNSIEKIDDDLIKNALAKDNHNKIPKALLANAPTYNILLLSDMTALRENPKKINTDDDNAKKIMFPEGSMFKKNAMNAEIAIPLKTEYNYDL